MADWTERYRPSTLSEVRGNDKARDAFAEWALSLPRTSESVLGRYRSVQSAIT